MTKLTSPMLGARDCVADAIKVEGWNGMDPKAESWPTPGESALGRKRSVTLEKNEELCATAVPSPALTASVASCSGTWGPQDFEAFALTEEESGQDFEASSGEDPSTDTVHQAAFATPEAAPSAVPIDALLALTKDGFIEMPPGLAPEEVAGANTELNFGADMQLHPDVGFLPEVVPWDGFLGGFGLEDVVSEECSALSLPGHAETGDWAWRIAPRPCMELDDLVPLVVRLGGAPDGSASLEVANGLEGFSEFFDEEGSKMLEDVRKCELQEKPSMTIAELHSLFNRW